jgi:hypothetical protein
MKGRDRVSDRNSQHIPPGIVNTIIVVVLVAWVINLGVGYVWPELSNSYVNVAFGLVLGLIGAARHFGRPVERAEEPPAEVDAAEGERA